MSYGFARDPADNDRKKTNVKSFILFCFVEYFSNQEKKQEATMIY